MVKPLLIAGPCSAESEKQVLETAKALKDFPLEYYRVGVWKPRTKPGSFEGIGSLALTWMEKARELYGVKIATEIANHKHAELALEHHLDAIWIGARTTTNPFAVQEIADTLRGSNLPVFVKNPVNPDVNLWIGAIERLQQAGIQHIGAIHRGFSSYGQNLYRNAPEWHIALEFHRQCPNIPLICDPSHISGDARLIQKIAQSAYDLQFDGLMIETHLHPQGAWSDAKQQITPDRLKEILDKLVIRQSPLDPSLLNALRQEIDKIDTVIAESLAKRMNVSEQIAEIKQAKNLPIYQPTRYAEMLKNVEKTAEEYDLNPQFLKHFVELLHEESIRIQSKYMNDPRESFEKPHKK